MKVILIAITALSIFRFVSLKKIVFFLAVSVMKLCFIMPRFLKKTA